MVALFFALAALGLTGAQVLFWSVPAVCSIAVLLRAALRVGVEADENEIVVTNLWRTHRVPWTLVTEVSLAGMFWPSSVAAFFALWSPLRIRTRDGRSVFIQASLDNVERVVAYLRESSTHAHKVTWGSRVD